MVANELMAYHGLKQTEAARFLGISQPAISLYQQKLRGNSIDLGSDPEISILITRHAEALVNGSFTRGDLLLSFCRICKTVRTKGLMCKIHKTFDPAVDVDKCDFCRNPDQLPCP